MSEDVFTTFCENFGADQDDLDNWFEAYTDWSQEEREEVVEHANQNHFSPEPFENLKLAAEDLDYEYNI